MTPKNEFSILQYDERDAHLAHLEITRQWNRIALPYAIICVLMFGTSLLIWILQLNFAIGVFTLFIAMLCLIFIRVSIRSLHFSRSHVNRSFEEWQQNQAMLRYISSQKAQADIIVNRGGQAVINQDNAQSQIIMANSEDPFKNIDRFFLHRHEFVERVARIQEQNPKSTGFERKWWLQNDGALQDYQWNDKTRISQKEHERLMIDAEYHHIAPEGRRRGSKGKVTTPLLG